MIKEAIEKIVEMSKPEIIDINGIQYASKRDMVRMIEPEPEPLAIYTLTGLQHYLETDIDGVNNPEELLIHVAAPDKVFLYSGLTNPLKQRFSYILAKALLPCFPFGDFLRVEDFIIKLQTHFVPSQETADLMAFVGNIRDQAETKVTDDGVSQQVEVKVGVARVENRVAPRQVELRPYRTFLEIEQIKTQFILRIRSGQNQQMPRIALFQADGGRWEQDAISAVAAWLKEHCPNFTIIA